MVTPAGTEIHEQALSLLEGERLRDKMNEDEDKSTENLSTITRSIAIGLALLTYTFFIDDKGHGFLTSHFLPLLAASVLGVLALTADALHYLFAMLQVQRLRNLIKTHIKEHCTLTLGILDGFNKNIFYRLRCAMFWSKMALVACGAVIIIVIILQSAAALAQNNAQ